MRNSREKIVLTFNLIRCKENHWNISPGEGCQACDCDSVGSTSESCNLYDGQCECKAGFGGRRCNECMANHWGVQCHPCECNYMENCDPQSGVCLRLRRTSATPTTNTTISTPPTTTTMPVTDERPFHIFKTIIFEKWGCKANKTKWDVDGSDLIPICVHTTPPSHIQIREFIQSCGPEFANYRQVCEDPAWSKLGEKNLTLLFPSGLQMQCQGHRPSQFIRRSSRCDNIIDCIDRSDETGCKHKHTGHSERGISFLHPLTKEIRQQPELTEEQLESISEWGHLGGSPKKDCGNQVAIGDNCYELEDLCGGKDGMPDFSHPDHIMLCQNWTFWSDFNKIDKLDVNRSNVRIDKKGGIIGYPCGGNFPGFISMDHFRLSLHTPGECMNEKARCPGKPRILAFCQLRIFEGLSYFFVRCLRHHCVSSI